MSAIWIIIQILLVVFYFITVLDQLSCFQFFFKIINFIISFNCICSIFKIFQVLFENFYFITVLNYFPSLCLYIWPIHLEISNFLLSNFYMIPIFKIFQVFLEVFYFF